MSEVYSRHGIQVHHGDGLDVMRTLPDASVHSLVTDPPAGIRFMNRAWDSDMGGRHSWVEWLSARMSEAFRVLKPGGYGLVWAMPRTSHWTAWALEDAGFEIRDCVVHLFGAGFPKSLDVSKAIDKARDDRADINRVTGWLAEQRDRAGLTNRQIDEAFGFHGMAGHWTAAPHLKIAQVPRWEQWEKLRELIGFGEDMDAEVWRLNGRKGTPGEAWDQREITQHATRALIAGDTISFDQRGSKERERRDIPATDAARQWEGFGTSLKPAAEHWWLIRKPMPGTVAQNVTEHGVGAINIGGCRVAHANEADRATSQAKNPGRGEVVTSEVYGAGRPQQSVNTSGRWPSNVVLTHAPDCHDDEPCDLHAIQRCTICLPRYACVDGCSVAELNAQSGVSSSPATPVKQGGRVINGGRYLDNDDAPTRAGLGVGYGDSGGASRFFPTFRWDAKAPSSERPKVDGKAHPTVKSLSLMRWMVRLVTPPGGTVLDCFAGTGTTGHAARAEGMKAILIELEADHIPLIVSRLDGYREPAKVDEATGKAEPQDLLDLLGEAS